MNDEEMREYIEEHTLYGSLARLRRELRAVLTAIRKAPPMPFIERVLVSILNKIEGLLGKLVRLS